MKNERDIAFSSQARLLTTEVNCAQPARVRDKLTFCQFLQTVVHAWCYRASPCSLHRPASIGLPVRAFCCVGPFLRAIFVYDNVIGSVNTPLAQI